MTCISTKNDIAHLPYPGCSAFHFRQSLNDTTVREEKIPVALTRSLISPQETVLQTNKNTHRWQHENFNRIAPNRQVAEARHP